MDTVEKKETCRLTSEDCKHKIPGAGGHGRKPRVPIMVVTAESYICVGPNWP